jgi:hypothetical protein
LSDRAWLKLYGTTLSNLAAFPDGVALPDEYSFVSVRYVVVFSIDELLEIHSINIQTTILTSD